MMRNQLWKIVLADEMLPYPIKFFKKESIVQHSFSPYQNNGGTTVTISEDDYSILASDTRIISGFSIPSRENTTLVKISNNILLSTSGMRADMVVLQEEFKRTVAMWETENKKNTPISSGAHVLSSILYSRRFFPFYTFNVITGKEFNGKIKTFSFDAIGSFESCFATCLGTGQFFIQPILDSHVKSNSNHKESKKNKILKSLILIKHLFLKASKRNIEIGDGMQIFILTKKGILIENSILRLD